MKRQSDDNAGQHHSKKKQKHQYSDRYHYLPYDHPSPKQNQSNSSSNSKHEDSKNNNKSPPKQDSRHDDPVSRLPPPTTQPGAIPSYVAFTVPKASDGSTVLPALPPIKDPSLTAAPFTHRSSLSYNRGPQTTQDLTYERLEILGDAYLELVASRLLFSRYSHLAAGQQSQLRELLVKNETLAEFSKRYGFELRVKADDLQGMRESAKDKGNKGLNKVLADVFEAYVAAVVLSDAEEGFAVVEAWLTALWAPKLLAATKADRTYVPLTHSESADPRTVYNPAAKAELQQRIVDHAVTKLSYEVYKESEELKGDRLGQNRHFIALYLTGYGYERKLLGKGEGKNKVEAGNWAATEAMFGDAKDVVEECEKKLAAVREERKKARAEKTESIQF